MTSALFLVSMRIGHQLTDALRVGDKERATRRGWVLGQQPIQDTNDPQRLTCPVCGQKWHILLNEDGDFDDHMALCPLGCLRDDYRKKERDQNAW